MDTAPSQKPVTINVSDHPNPVKHNAAPKRSKRLRLDQRRLPLSYSFYAVGENYATSPPSLTPPQPQPTPP